MFLGNSEATEQTVVFTVASLRPSSSKRGIRGDLVTGDMGIQLHKVHQINKEALSMTVSTSPYTFSAVADDKIDMASTSLVLTPAALSSMALNKMRVWDASDEIEIRLRTDKLLLGESRDVQDEVTQLLAAAPKGMSVDADDEGGKDKIDVLEKLKEACLVAETVPHDGARVVWSSTDEGKAMVDAGMTCTNARPVLAARDVSLDDMFVFELSVKLEATDWSWKVCASKKDTKRAKSQPHIAGKLKRCWIKYHANPKEAKLDKPYLKCLLMSATIAMPIPHPAATNVYNNCWIHLGRKR